MKKISFILAIAMALTLLSSTRPFAAGDETGKEAPQGNFIKLPEWVQNFTFKGDLRLRYQSNKRQETKGRHRGRIRARLGADVKVTDEIKVAAGLATGGTDPRSTNQTLQNTFETPDIRLDYAYGQYKPLSWVTLKGGKIKGMPFWKPSDLLWDSDINPEGGGAQLKYSLRPNVGVFFNTSCFILDESGSDTSDPFMYVVQPGFDVKVMDFINLKAAVTYYGFSHVKGTTLDYSSGTNTLFAGGLMYNYDSIGGSAELGFKKPFKVDFIPYIAALGEYINNPDPSSGNDGFLVGLKVGSEKVSKKGQWQAKYLYRRLKRDAFLDTFPDSDFYDGQTNVKGHEVIFEYGLFKHVILGLDYYYTQPIEGITKLRENLFQFDIVFKL